MNIKQKIIIITLIILSTSSLSLAVIKHAFPSGKKPSEQTNLSQQSEIPATERILLKTALYRQTDPRWKDQRIGGSFEKIEDVGCTLSASSMALSHFGFNFDPATLNKALIAKRGYTKRGWLIWKAISKVTDHRVQVFIPRKVNYTHIDKALKANQPVLVKVKYFGMFNHWVIVVGKQGKEYLIKDPLGKTSDVEKLSKFTSGIYAIRIFIYTK